MVILDNLTSGRETFVPGGATFARGSVEDSAFVSGIFSAHHFVGVIHLAGFKFAGESMVNPLAAHTANTLATMTLLQKMRDHSVSNLVFSSSCSVYGDTGEARVDESFPLNPASPYGRSKLAAEMIIRDSAQAFGLRQTSLRYFNVIGTRLPGVFDLSPHNIVPAAHEALLRGDVPRMNGDDYDTPDGTCVRDYVDVGELTDAHLTAAMILAKGPDLEPIYNLGSESGASVKDIVDAARQISGKVYEPIIGPRRPGDSASIVAKSDLARRDLGVESKHSPSEDDCCGLGETQLPGTLARPLTLLASMPPCGVDSLLR